MQKNRLMFIVSLIFLIILISAVSAADNETAFLVGETDENIPVSISNNGSDILKASNDYYFDAAVEKDGDGSKANPYKYLTADRIKANSNIYLADGEYNLDTSKSVQQVNIVGGDVEKTIIKFDGIAFTVSNYLNVKNITFIGSSITNYNQFTAVNTIFMEGFGSKPDSYTNNYGGAIYTAPDHENARVSVDNCTFKDNYAQYGGAIYMGSGVLEVSNCLFFDNYAYNYGGSIACDYITNVSVKKSKFYNSTSKNDAGGSIYIRQSSKFTGDDITVVNSTSTFGGAIATLNTDVKLNKLNLEKNSAKYDGGAIYHMYGSFSVFNSEFTNNSAANGGALFVDNSTEMYLRNNGFTKNHAEHAAGAIFSLFNKKLQMPFEKFNRFNGNTAEFQNNIYDVNELNLTIGNRNYTLYNVDINQVTHLPSRYSLVDKGFTTTVKDQQSSGNCWAFTAIAVLESCILKASGDNLDLSEENMKNVIELYSDYGWKMDTNEGGYDYMPWGYLASWLGPISEMDDMFDDKSTLSPVINSIMHVQNIRFLNRNSYTDNNEIKKAILQYGAVGTSMYYDPYYLNSPYSAYYNWVNSAGNHAVTIVGWDDTFSKSNFKFGSTIDGDGAWIVRNSWGPNWGDNGYFYVSYYDATFARPNVENIAYTIILNDTIRFDKNYQYDIAGMTDYFLNSYSNVWYKNVFKATSDEYLAAVSTYFEKFSDWMATVYVNGEIKDVLSGVTNPGYYTFNLNKLITLKAGDVFEVVFNITTDGAAGFPVSEEVSLNKLTYSPGISYVSWDGVNWSDLYYFSWQYATHTYTSQVACIKAFTVTEPINTNTVLNIDLVEDRLLNLTAFIKDEYGNLLKYGSVTFNINGENKIVNVKNGIANLMYESDKRALTISATFEAEGYNKSSDTAGFTIPKIPVQLNLDISQNYNDVNITVMASKLLNESVIININGNETLLELFNGTNIMSLKNLSNDIYQVAVLLLDDSWYIAETTNDEFTIDLHKTSILSDDLTVNDAGSFIYNITLVDEFNNPVADRDIVFILNNSTYDNKTDKNGQALINITLKKGVYDVEVKFNGDNDYFKSNANNTIKVKSKIWINLDINTYQNNAFVNIYASNLLNETFTVLINNKSQNVASHDGVAILKLNGLSDGDYNVEVLLDDEEYEFNNASSQFTIQYGEPANITTDVKVVGNDAIVEIEVENATGYVTVIVDGVNDIIELENSHADYAIKNIAPGNHSLVVIYGGGDFRQSIKSDVFNIAKRESEINLTVNNAKIGKIFNITAEVTPNATGFVSVNVNGSEYLINLSKTNVLSLVLNNAGKYSVVATYLGDKVYNLSKSDEYELTVSDKSVINVALNIPDAIQVGDEVEFNLSSDADVEIKAYIDDELQEISNKKIQYNALNAGLHTIQIIFDENEDYYGLNKTFSFKVTKKDANIFIDVPQTVLIGENITINPVTESDGKINITINGQVINSSYVIPFKGTFVIRVESAETEMYNSAVNTTYFTSQKLSTSTALNVSAGKSGEESKISVNVDGQPEGIAIISVNGTDYSLNLTQNKELKLVLNAGSYSIVATYMGNEKYDSSISDEAVLVVEDKLPANIEIEIPDNVKVGDTVAINVSADTSSELTVLINGQVQEIVSGNGILGISLKDLLRAMENGKVIYTVSEEGIYNITVTAKENEDYLGQTVTKVFEVTKKDALLDIVPISDAKVGDNVTIAVVNETDGALTIKVNGETVTGDYKIIKAGSYTVIVESAETDAYNKGFAAFTFNVDEEPVEPKQEAQVTVETPSDVKAGNDTAVSVIIPNATGNVVVIIDGKENPLLLDENGAAIVPIENITGGDHSIVVIYPGDDKFNATYKAATFNVEEEPVPEPDNNITVVVDGKKYPAELVNGTAVVNTNPVPEKEDSIVTIDVPTGYKAGELLNVTVSIPRAAGNVSAIVDGVETVVSLDENGNAIVTIDNLTAGEHNIVVIYPGDDSHKSAYKVINIPVEVLDSEFSDVIVNDLNITATLVNSLGDAIANAEIKYTIGNVAGTTVTDADGVFTIAGVAGEKIVIEYAGSDAVLPTSISITLNDIKPALKSSSMFNISDGTGLDTYTVDFNVGERGNDVSFRLTDDRGNPIKNATVGFAYKTVYFNRTTDENGIVHIGISTQISGEYLCALSYLGDETHKATFVAFYFNIQQKPLEISASAKTFKSSVKTKKYTVTLKTGPYNSKDGKTYLKAGKKVTMKLAGKTYTAKTNAKGHATFKITKLTKKGKYTAQISFEGDKTYTDANKSVKITIK